MAAPAQADRRRYQSLLAIGDFERSECGPRAYCGALRGEGDPRIVYELGGSRGDGDELRAADGALRGRGEVPPRTRIEHSLQHECGSADVGRSSREVDDRDARRRGDSGFRDSGAAIRGDWKIVAEHAAG